MNQDRVKVAIVAPVHNRRELTLLCLRSLSRIDRTGLDVQTWIVDDGSSDGTYDAITLSFPDVNVIHGSGDLWFTEGTNVGVRAALEWCPDFVLMINDDEVFDDAFLQNLVATAVSNPRSIVGPILLLWNQPHKLFQTAPVWRTMDGGWHHWRHQTIWSIPEKPWYVDIIVGNCVLVPTLAFRECGLMNSKKYPNFGDAEFTPRLKRAGWKLIIDPRSRVFCQPNTPPDRVRHMPPRKMFTALVTDLGNVHNLRRRLYANLDGAPTKIAGLTAFIVFLGRALVGRSTEIDQPPGSEEVPLRDSFKRSVVHG